MADLPPCKGCERDDCSCPVCNRSGVVQHRGFTTTCGHCTSKLVGDLRESLASALRRAEAWRALATESSGSARSLDFSLHETSSYGAEIVNYPGYGHVVATDAVYNAESFQAAAIDLATKLGLLDSASPVKP